MAHYVRHEAAVSGKSRATELAVASSWQALAVRYSGLVAKFLDLCCIILHVSFICYSWQTLVSRTIAAGTHSMAVTLDSIKEVTRSKFSCLTC